MEGQITSRRVSEDQTSIYNFMVQQLDGTQNEWGWCKQKLGANAILAVSLAVCKVGAAVLNISPYKYSTFLTWLVTRSWYCLFLPSMSSMVDHTLGKTCYVGAYQASSFKEAMKMGVEVYHNLKVVIGMDVAASEFYGSEKTYDLNFKEENNNGSQKISRDQLKDLYKPFIFGYPIVSIEDPFDQDDWEHYAKLTGEIGAEVQIVGDDLLVTNPKRVKKAIKEKTCNALPLKVNQIGSVTESIEAVKMSKRAGWGVMASHHSGETEDTFIADLSVGLATGQIKTGAPCRSERLAKYNQLLRIEEELGSEAVYAEAKFRVPVEPY
ncbi:enolase 2-like isoform X7 [Olea europaea var. sylvestris]|uniref:enolase 2-like isoform X7 n=1 Tax=Olea europaea var. sylvestris TaxID=158386 RepID=UPI000C1D2CCC|nr:enolase 2-like isoform X7 [Olea europaea var. sylvestris]XP_022866351.1 enolase 2-like isoform X7 [Olea europaea var. sylvestris]XP_022866352.1 enolase 2-like isoform X7 [Olea europaea var. sylvestris]